MCPICKREYEDLSLLPVTLLVTGAPGEGGGGRQKSKGGGTWRENEWEEKEGRDRRPRENAGGERK